MSVSPDDDDLLLLEDGDDAPPEPSVSAPRWRMLVVDDEVEVHSITRMVLTDFTYRDRPIEILSAYSAAEAMRVLAVEPAIAMILLDVVMETDDAGLRLVHHVREVLGNRKVRIILRTGQPGQAPERSVILGYDINDYKAKTQLTAQSLFTTTVAALRSYEDIVTLDAYREGLEKIVDGSRSLFQIRSMRRYAAGVLTQLSALVGTGPDGILCVQRGNPEGGDRGRLYVLAGSGRYEALVDDPVTENIDPQVQAAIGQSLASRTSIFGPDSCTLFFCTPNRRECVVYLRANRRLEALDSRLIELFCGGISVGFDTLALMEQNRRCQDATVPVSAEDTEPSAGGPHLPDRAGALAERIARRLSKDHLSDETLDDATADLIGFATTINDVGMVGLNPAILLKTTPLTAEEWDQVERYTRCGRDFLKRMVDRIDGPCFLKLAVQIAQCHHENYDGTGYPDGLAGQEIPLAARIVAVAKAYCTLLAPRGRRPAHSEAEAVAQIMRLSGFRFDPRVVAALVGEVTGQGQTKA